MSDGEEGQISERVRLVAPAGPSEKRQTYEGVTELRREVGERPKVNGGRAREWRRRKGRGGYSLGSVKSETCVGGRGSLRINHCRQLLRRAHPLVSQRSQSPTPTQSLKPRPSPARNPGARFPLSRGPIVPVVARERKVYADGLCRRWARGE